MSIKESNIRAIEEDILACERDIALRVKERLFGVMRLCSLIYVDIVKKPWMCRYCSARMLNNDECSER